MKKQIKKLLNISDKKIKAKRVVSPKNSNQLGIWGENFACHYLKKKKFEILFRRYYTRFGEIDIIASKKSCLYFIEVKLRSQNPLSHPLMSINQTKLKRFKKSIKFFLLKHPEFMDKFSLQTIAFSIEIINNHKAKVNWTPFFL